MLLSLLYFEFQKECKYLNVSKENQSPLLLPLRIMCQHALRKKRSILELSLQLCHLMSKKKSLNKIISLKLRTLNLKTNSKRERHNLSNSQTNQKPNARFRRNINVRNNFTYMFINITIFYIVLHRPTIILIVFAIDEPFYYWYSMDVTILNFLMMLRRSFVINHIVNPFIYGYII